MRERDIRNALQQALVDTGQFSEVTLRGLPEDYGERASDLTAASIQPGSTRLLSGWDAAPGGGRSYRCTIALTILARHEDPQLRDELAEQLLNAARDAFEGQALSPGFALPQKSEVSAWRWLPATPPERRIAATLSYDYLQDGWDSADTSQ